MSIHIGKKVRITETCKDGPVPDTYIGVVVAIGYQAEDTVTMSAFAYLLDVGFGVMQTVYIHDGYTIKVLPDED